jgi:hypothetical protein
MTGIKDFNFPEFHERAAQWRSAGWFVINPAESFGGKQDLDLTVYFRQDVEHLLEVDAIAMLPGWEDSKGARFELLLAQKIGLSIFRGDSMGPLFLHGEIITTVNNGPHADNDE